MSEVDFRDFNSAEAWFETQSIEMRCAMASRAALRVVAEIGRSKASSKGPLALASLRATLISAGRGSGRPTDMDWGAAADPAANSATRSANSTADSTVFSAVNSAAYSCLSAANFTTISANSATNSVNSAANSAADFATDFATTLDASLDHAALIRTPVWGEQDVPDIIAENHRGFLGFLFANDAWTFWREFYEGMWNGTFDNWDLAFEVIRIEDAEWEKGHVHIDEVIEALRDGRVSPASTEEKRTTELGLKT